MVVIMSYLCKIAPQERYYKKSRRVPNLLSTTKKIDYICRIYFESGKCNIYNEDITPYSSSYSTEYGLSGHGSAYRISENPAHRSGPGRPGYRPFHFMTYSCFEQPLKYSISRPFNIMAVIRNSFVRNHLLHQK